MIMTKKNSKTNNIQQQSEFKENPDCYIIFASNNLIMGRTIVASSLKGKYCQDHQGDLIIFNANVLTSKHGKVWYGDLNVTQDFDNLKNVADQLNENLYILMEGDARFGYENQPIEQLLKKARTVIKCNLDKHNTYYK